MSAQFRIFLSHERHSVLSTAVQEQAPCLSFEASFCIVRIVMLFAYIMFRQLAVTLQPEGEDCVYTCLVWSGTGCHLKCATEAVMAHILELAWISIFILYSFFGQLEQCRLQLNFPWISQHAHDAVHVRCAQLCHQLQVPICMPSIATSISMPPVFACV